MEVFCRPVKPIIFRKLRIQGSKNRFRPLEPVDTVWSEAPWALSNIVSTHKFSKTSEPHEDGCGAGAYPGPEMVSLLGWGDSVANYSRKSFKEATKRMFVFHPIISPG